MPAYKTNLEVQIKQDQKQGLGLVDYEQTDTFPVWKFRGGSTIIYEDSIQKQKSIYQIDQIYKECTEIQANKNQLLKVNKFNKQYEIILSVQQPTFIVVKDIRSQQGSEYPLIVNSIIRLGRVEYKVIEERNKIMQTYQAPCQMKQNLDQQTYQCKFCFIDGKQCKEQPFLTNICRCSGSNMAVHLECLRFWVDSNITKEETQFGLILKWSKQHECWVCKDPLPIRVQLDNQFIDLFTLDRPDLQYILLENINKDKNTLTELYLIHGLLSDNIKIGRGFQCDIKAQDITVSRHHATIKFIEGNFVIQDNKSKFGTLVQIDKKIEIDCQACSFQIGKLLINFIQSDQIIIKGAPSTQHKLTQLPQINKQLEEDEPIMDDDSFQLENK